MEEQEPQTSIDRISQAPSQGRPDLSIYFFEDPWRDLAACEGVNQQIFFPERGESTKKAQGICRDCEVRIDCLTHAVEVNERFGIWGGLPERPRRRIKHLVAKGMNIIDALEKVEEERRR